MYEIFMHVREIHVKLLLDIFYQLLKVAGKCKKTVDILHSIYILCISSAV